MNKEIFIKWTDDGVGGIFKIEFTDFVHMLKYEPVSGSMVPFGELMGFLWNSNLLDEIRESTKELSRKGEWRVKSRKGFSGCTDWYIQYENKGLVKRTKYIHESMNGKANLSFDLWSKDLYDILWWLSYKESYKFGDEGDEEDTVTFMDITEEVMSRRREFRDNSLPPCCGFGGKTPEEVIIDEDKLYS